MVDSLYYSSRKIPERCENYFVDYRINYQKLCYLMSVTVQKISITSLIFSMQFCVVKVRLMKDLDPFVLVLYWVRSITEIDSFSLAYECEWNLPIVQFLKGLGGSFKIGGWPMLGVETYLTCLWDLSMITS